VSRPRPVSDSSEDWGRLGHVPIGNRFGRYSRQNPSLHRMHPLNKKGAPLSAPSVGAHSSVQAARRPFGCAPEEAELPKNMSYRFPTSSQFATFHQAST